MVRFAVAAVVSLSMLSGAAALLRLQKQLDSDLQVQQLQLDPNRILCPVIAAMWQAGDLTTDEFGNVELEDLKTGLMDAIGVSEDLAEFQAVGIVGFNNANKETELSRDRCIRGFTDSGAACAAKRENGYSTADTKRWLNIFEMNGKQAIEHGFSTAVRGGGTNMPDLSSPCNGYFPCQDQFDKFYVPHATPHDTDVGRFYAPNIVAIICHARTEGDMGGEFSYNPHDGLPFTEHVPELALVTGKSREWQMKAAMLAWLRAFGRTDENTGELYLTLEDARIMMMEGRYPEGFEKRPSGCLLPSTECTTPSVLVFNYELPCQDEEWWQDTSCKVGTGENCSATADCSGGASCFRGVCLCGRDSNGVGMCVEEGVCTERTSQCTYFGEPCVRVPADNPVAADA